MWGAEVNDGQKGGYRDLVCAENRTVILEVQAGLCPHYVWFSMVVRYVNGTSRKYQTWLSRHREILRSSVDSSCCSLTLSFTVSTASVLLLVEVYGWHHRDLARECEEHLGHAGFCAVQVLPVNELKRETGLL